MPSELQRIAQGLLGSIERIPGMVNYLLNQAQQLRDQAAAIGAMQSANPSARYAALHLDAAAKACEEAAHYAAQVPPKATAWAQEMVSGQRTISDGGDGTRPASAVWRDPDKPGSALEPMDPFDETAGRVMRDLPVRKPKDKTRGVWVDEEGKRHEWVSGFDEYRKQADDLAVELGLGRLWTTSHVEIKFAMFMRERGLADARLILNNIPCDDEEFSCENLFKWFLPAGSKLTIYGPDKFKRTYPQAEDGSSR
jgi:hypothetical protein